MSVYACQSKVLVLGDLNPLEIGAPSEEPPCMDEVVRLLGLAPDGGGRCPVEALPFAADDATAGSECELQAVVLGARQDVDLPITIEESNFYANIVRRALAGDTSRSVVTSLEKFLADNAEGVWENSWVRFPMRFLSPFAKDTFESDLLADKRAPDGGLRSDVRRFIYFEEGEKHVRIPISYLIKLSLADALGAQPDAPATLHRTGRRLMNHFLSDNTSPETFSFHVTPLRPETGMGRSIAKETSKRFLLTQLLIMYANHKFRLMESGQEALAYFAPHPPLRQKALNDCISDAFYRELFMSPCLSGWDRGEVKHRYMGLCHQVLSRSQMNAVAKLREAGIITRNLVVLPNISNVSLANNGTHISLGSRKLTRLRADAFSGFGEAHEKCAGDLAIKMMEHFLPLFVGSYSAGPYRLDFTDFHPEKALSFLPHELDFTHLRMIWRRWKKKARLKAFGQPVTPFGLGWLDKIISTVFRLKGDFVPDFRLLDYFVALMSTERSPALDGRVGNGDRLKQDLAELGVFDPGMATYLLQRLREYKVMGFSGFEARYYSQFHSLEDDMGPAADLQALLNALAFKYMAEGKLSHAHIPDEPFIESERRHIFFGTAIGIPTFFVRRDTRNVFLKCIVERTERVRPSHRYPGFLRVYNQEYRKALVRILREDAADIIEMLGLERTMQDLARRIEDPGGYAVSGKLTREILAETGGRSPMGLSAEEFNRAAERRYRNGLRKKHVLEAFRFWEEDFRKTDPELFVDFGRREELSLICGERHALQVIGDAKNDVVEGRASLETLRQLINLMLATVRNDMRLADRQIEDGDRKWKNEASIHRAVRWDAPDRAALRG